MRSILFIFICIIPFFALAQKSKKKKNNEFTLDVYDKELLNKYQDTLAQYMTAMRYEPDDVLRINACYDFIPLFVKALKVPASFLFNFDSLKHISCIYPEDKSFRIFTWQLEFNNSEFRYYGVLQFNSKDVHAITFYDFSNQIDNYKDTITDAKHWYGAVYYNMITKKIKGKNYYTIFGWKGINIFGTIKVADVLHFDEEGSAIFGAPIFYITDSLTQEQNIDARYCLEFKRDASTTLNYDTEKKMIVYDHVIDEVSPELKRPFAQIPDGTYEGFQWKKGKWQHVDMVFDVVMDEPFFSKPIFMDNKGKTMPPMKK